MRSAALGLATFMTLLGFGSAAAQPTQCYSFYDANAGNCRPCSDPGGGATKRSWKNFGSYCISCTLNCPISTFTSSVDATRDENRFQCGSGIDEGNVHGLYLALDPADPMLDELAAAHAAAAELLTAMLPRSGAVVPIDWSSGFAPFSALPSTATYAALRSGGVPDSGAASRFPGTLTANYFAETTVDGYRLVLRFEGSVDTPGATVHSLLGGSCVTVALARADGTAVVDLGERQKRIPLHRIEEFEVH